MKRASNKITDTIKSGKKPRRKAPPRVVILEQYLSGRPGLSAQARGEGYLRTLEHARRVGDAALERACIEEIAAQTGKRLAPQVRTR